METVEPGSDYDTSEAESDGDEVPAQSTVEQQTTGLDENHDTSNMPKLACRGDQIKDANCNSAESAQSLSSKAIEGQLFDQARADVNTPKAAHAASDSEQAKQLNSAAVTTAPKRRKRHGAPMQEGTYIGGGRRMMCYCPKHSHVAEKPLAAAPSAALAPSIAAALPVTAVAAQAGQAEASVNLWQAQRAAQTSEWELQALCTGQNAAYQLPQHGHGCVRGLPFNHACRRGQREPDAIAAALAKRLFVAKTPYIIGAARQHEQQQLPCARMHLTEKPFLVPDASSERSAVPNSSVPAAAKTQTQRFRDMQETVGRRLTCGKSAIHGLGAFTKQPHDPGNIVCTYLCTDQLQRATVMCMCNLTLTCGVCLSTPQC